MPGRGDVKQLLAQVLIQAGNCREQHRHLGTQGAVGGTGSVQHRGDCQEEHGPCGRQGLSDGTGSVWHRGTVGRNTNKILLLVFFHSTEQCELGWSDTFVGPFWEGKKDSQWKQLSCDEFPVADQ